MKFLAIQWLWALLLLPVIYFLVHWDESRKRERFSRFAAEPVWQRLAPELDWRARLRKGRLWVLALGFAFVALARPQWGMHEEVNHTTGLDVMIALDVSNSMDVEDVAPSRLKKAKHFVRSLVEKLAGDRVGLVIFAAGSALDCPLTLDLSYVLDRLQMVTPKFIPSQGTDIGVGLETALHAMDRGAEDLSKPESSSGQPPSRVIILISDGEDHENAATEAAQKIKISGTKLYVLGVGTEKGAPIPVHDDSGNLLTYKKDKKGQPIISQFHPDDLLQIASAAGGRYWNLSPSESEIEDILQDMGALNRAEFQERKYMVYEDRYQIPLAVAIILLMIELGIPARKIISPLLVTIGLYLGLATVSRTAVAGPKSVDSYLKNEEGLKAFKEGKVDEAQKNFGEAQALDPSQPELNFNQGVVNLKKGNTDGAILSFREAARESMAANNRPILGKSLFNLGSALSKKGDIKGAVRSYLGAINSAQGTQDKQLEQDARKNLQLLAQQQEQQKQKQQQGGKDQQQKQQDQQQQQQQQQDQKQQQNQQQNSQQSQQQQQQQDKKDGSKGDQEKKDKQSSQTSEAQQDAKKNEQNNQNQPNDQNGKPSEDRAQKYEDPSHSRGKGFSSGKMSQEDADRVMEELKNREKDLEGRLSRRHARAQNNEKDW